MKAVKRKHVKTAGYKIDSLSRTKKTIGKIINLAPATSNLQRNAIKKQ